MRGVSGFIPVVVLAAVALSRAAFAGPPADGDRPAKATTAAKVPRVLHIHIKGDLDSMRLVRDFAAELARGEEAGITHLVLELDGNRWRADVVWGIVQAARAVGVPTSTWLVDPKDNRIGTGQAIVGLLASTTTTGAPNGDCWLAPKTTISLEPGDDLRAAAPDSTDWERIDRELSGAAWTALKNRGADTELGPALLSPGSSGGNLWSVSAEGGGPLRLTANRPTGDTAQSATRVVWVLPGATTGADAAAGAKVEIPAELAGQLALVKGQAHAIGEVLVAMSATAVPRTTREIQSGLVAARNQVEQDAAKIDRALEQAERMMHDLPRPSEPDYPVKKRKAGKESIPLLEAAQGVLQRTERTIGDYPELLHDVAPGKTPVGQEPKLVKRTWSTSFQQRRDELVKLMARAREYAGQ